MHILSHSPSDLQVPRNTALLLTVHSVFFPRPIFGFTTINQDWLVLMYVKIWGLYPPDYCTHWSYAKNKKILSRLATQFRQRAKIAGIKIKRYAGLNEVLIWCQRHREEMIFRHELADEFCRLYRDVPLAYHDALIPFVYLKASKYCDWQLVLQRMEGGAK